MSPPCPSPNSCPGNTINAIWSGARPESTQKLWPRRCPTDTFPQLTLLHPHVPCMSQLYRCIPVAFSSLSMRLRGIACGEKGALVTRYRGVSTFVRGGETRRCEAPRSTISVPVPSPLHAQECSASEAVRNLDEDGRDRTSTA